MRVLLALPILVVLTVPAADLLPWQTFIAAS
jgi:hypothetical protein